MLKPVGVVEGVNCGTVKEEAIAHAGLLNQIAKGLPPDKVREVGVVEGQNDGGVKDAMLARGGLMNEIQKGKELKVVPDRHVEKLGTNDITLQVPLPPTPPPPPPPLTPLPHPSLPCPLPSFHPPLPPSPAPPPPRPPRPPAPPPPGPPRSPSPRPPHTQSPLTSPLIPPLPHLPPSAQRAGLLNEINKRRVDDEEEEQKVARALHEAQAGDLMAAISSGTKTPRLGSHRPQSRFTLPTRPPPPPAS